MIIEPKIALAAGAVPPDSYDDSSGLIPSDDFVVSRFHDGTVASRYMDMSWNRTPYDPDGHHSWLHFPYWEDDVLTPERESLTREVHWLMFLLIWKKPGFPMSFATLKKYMSLFRYLAGTALDNSCQIKDILSKEDRIVQFLESGIAGFHIQTLSSILSILLELGPKQTGLIVPGEKILLQLRKHVKRHKNRNQQNPPIPTRIYSKMIAGLLCELDDFEKVADRYFALLAECVMDPLIGRSRASQYRKVARFGLTDRGQRPHFNDLLQKYNLEDYFAAKQLQHDVSGLSKGLSEAQMVAKLLIHTFSGMRDEETTELPYHCLETSVTNGRTHYLLAGRTTKLNNGLFKRARWATSREGQRAVLLAQRIATVIYEAMGEMPEPNEERVNIYPLLVSTAYLSLTSRPKAKGHRGFLAATFEFCDFGIMMSRFLVKIEDADLHELEQIDPHRAWRSEDKFQIGREWPLRMHQLRRSLALYAQRSGLVSLPSLRRQLQHITEEMSRYYARGSAYAKNFIGDDPQHFGLEWQKTTPVSAALSYILNVLHSDEVLFGGHVNWMERNLKSADGVVCIDRETTMRRFKRGELFYRETSLGGCTNVNECKQVAIKWLDVECIGNCANLVGKLSKLEEVIVVQKNWITTLSPESIEYRTEKEDLDVLVAAREKALEKKALKEALA